MGIPAQSDYTDEASLLYDVIDDVFTGKTTEEDLDKQFGIHKEILSDKEDK